MNKAVSGTNPWPAACAIAGLFAALLGFGYYLRPLLSGVGLYLRTGNFHVVTAETVWGRMAVWAVICAALLLGWRWLAATAAWLAAVGEGVVLLTYAPEHSIVSAWLLIAAAAVAVLLTVAAGASPGTRLIGPARTALLAGAGLLVGASPPILHALAEASPAGASRGERLVILVIDERLVAAVTGTTIAATIAAGVISIAGTAPPVRRRSIVVLLAMASLLTVAQLGTDRSFDLSVIARPLLSEVALAIAFVVVPLPVVLVGALIVARRENPRLDDEARRA